jgi:hypothetical protein
LGEKLRSLISPGDWGIVKWQHRVFSGGPNWEINVGKSGKWLKKFIPAHIYSQCLKIYVGNGKTGIIENIRLLSQLLLEFGTEISSGSTYQYPSEDHQRTYKYLDKFIAENNLE